MSIVEANHRVSGSNRSARLLITCSSRWDPTGSGHDLIWSKDYLLSSPYLSITLSLSRPKGELLFFKGHGGYEHIGRGYEISPKILRGQEHFFKIPKMLTPPVYHKKVIPPNASSQMILSNHPLISYSREQYGYRTIQTTGH